MRIALVALALSLAPAALADTSSFHDRMYQRYCDKLKESPDAYAAFVKRMRTVTGYTFSDFAQLEPNAPLRAECRGASSAQASSTVARAEVRAGTR
jgi:hypothetical protein